MKGREFRDKGRVSRDERAGVSRRIDAREASPKEGEAERIREAQGVAPSAHPWIEPPEIALFVILRKPQYYNNRAFLDVHEYGAFRPPQLIRICPASAAAGRSDVISRVVRDFNARMSWIISNDGKRRPLEPAFQCDGRQVGARIRRSGSRLAASSRRAGPAKPPGGRSTAPAAAPGASPGPCGGGGRGFARPRPSNRRP